jgi:hypothetical protein
LSHKAGAQAPADLSKEANMKEPKKEKNLKFLDGKWYVDFTFKGKRIRQISGYTKGQAQNTFY